LVERQAKWRVEAAAKELRISLPAQVPVWLTGYDARISVAERIVVDDVGVVELCD